MAKTPKIQPTPLPKPQPDPFNLQAEKRYIFNETGNIMMASTEIGSEEISQDVRDVFAEVSVFFAAMTRAMSTTINKKTGKFYSIYDYEAIQGIIDGSGLFIQVSEEDVTHEMSSWGVTVSKELIEGLLGLATGSGELVFAQAMVSSIGKRGLQISGKNDKSDGRVGTIVFVCEYLLGMPVVSALVCYVDSKIASQSFTLGPCIKEQSSALHMLLHKDTYMFVTPNFIRKYAGDLLSAESDLEYLELVDFLQDLVERKPTVTYVGTPNGNKAPAALSIQHNYYILGTFLTEVTGLDPQADNTTIKYTVDFEGGESIQASNPQSNVVGFTPTAPMPKAQPATITAHITTGTGRNATTTTKAIVTTGAAFTVIDPGGTSNSPNVSGIFDSTGSTQVTGNLVTGTIYTIKGSDLLGGSSTSTISVKVTGANPPPVSLSGTPTETEVKFKVDHAFTSKPVAILSSRTTIVATSPLTAT